MNTTAMDVKVADEVWIATALLHYEHPDAEDFTVQEIVERASSEHLLERLRPGVYVHANTHCVANRPPSPAALRMLYETRPGRRRLFRETDEADPRRKGRIKPRRDQIPEAYVYLLDRYDDQLGKSARDTWLGGIFEMEGAGKGLYAGEDPDAYVRRLREGWE